MAQALAASSVLSVVDEVVEVEKRTVTEVMDSLALLMGDASGDGFAQSGVTPLSHVSSDWDVWIQEEIATLKSLGKNWDGYGAEAPIGALVNCVEGFLRSVGSQAVMPPKPEVTPSNDGGVMLEWETAKGDFFLEILPKDEINVHVETADMEFEGSLTECLEDAKKAWAHLLIDS